jgi:hypothetical protein
VLAHGATAHQHRANFRYAFSVFEFASSRGIRVKTFSCGSGISRLIYPEMNPVPAVNIEAKFLVIGYGNTLRGDCQKRLNSAASGAESESREVSLG